MSQSSLGPQPLSSSVLLSSWSLHLARDQSHWSWTLVVFRSLLRCHLLSKVFPGLPFSELCPHPTLAPSCPSSGEGRGKAKRCTSADDALIWGPPGIPPVLSSRGSEESWGCVWWLSLESEEAWHLSSWLEEFSHNSETTGEAHVLFC